MQRFDLQGQDFKRNPFPTLAAMRDRGPVVPGRLKLLGRVHFVTTYEAVSELLKRKDDFVVDAANAGKRRGFAEAWWLPPSLRLLAQNMLGKDDPDHRRLRHLVDQAFARKQLGAFRSTIENTVDELIGNVRARGEADFVAAFARPLPLAVICDVLGLAKDEQKRFMRWMIPISSAGSVLDIFRMLPAINRISRYLRAQFARRRREPREDLITYLVELSDGGEVLSEDDLLAMCFLLFVAGHETTTHLLSGALRALLEHPHEHAAVVTGRALWPDAVEELHRYVTPVQMSKPRFASVDTELAGVPIGRGQTLVAMLACANSDPAAFEAPERLNLRRGPVRHLGFGTGSHMCLGITLARLEVQIALERLLLRCPRIALARAHSPFVYTRRIGLRALSDLHVRTG